MIQTQDLPISIPGALLEEIIDNISSLKDQINEEFENFANYREIWRERLVDAKKITRVDCDNHNKCNVLAVDGAHLTDSDRVNTYSISCCARVGAEGRDYAQSTCFALLPHTADANIISLGLMTMQEIMVAVETVESRPDVLCLIDGSRVASIINIGNFYSTFKNSKIDMLLHKWRQRPDIEPGRTIAKFESRNWFQSYLSDYHIIGSAKMVVSTDLVSAYGYEANDRLDDKAFAAIVLDIGEIIEKKMKKTAPDYFKESLYPYAYEMNDLCQHMAEDTSLNGSPQNFLMDNKSLLSQIVNVYYKPDEIHGVFKLEMNRAFLADRKRLGELLTWWKNGLDTPDIQEPLENFIADKVAKQAVVAAKDLLTNIKRQDLNNDNWGYVQPYRS